MLDIYIPRYIYRSVERSVELSLWKRSDHRILPVIDKAFLDWISPHFGTYYRDDEASRRSTIVAENMSASAANRNSLA